MDPLRIAILSSHTASPLGRHLHAFLASRSIDSAIDVGGFDQYMRELLDPAAHPSGAPPDATVLLVDRVSVIGDPTELCFTFSPDDRRRVAEERLAGFLDAIEAYAAAQRGKVIVANFLQPTTSPLGHADEKDACGYKALVREMNVRLEDRFRASRQVIVFDLDGVVRTHGERGMVDPKMEYVAGMKFSEDGFRHVARSLTAILAPLRVPPKKCLVLDLDGTLWGGVVGEDGVSGIALGPTAPGNAYVAFQKAVLHLYHQGVILAIASRNNPDDALAVIREHPHMQLREKHFAAVRISWEDKATMLRALAETLDIGLDSIVFVDDDPVQRALVRETLPEVSVLDLPDDPAHYAEMIERSDLFARTSLTEEDRSRGAQYALEQGRRTARASAGSYESFLRGLHLRVTVGPVTEALVARAAQLTQKTNQFNLTTKRYSEEDIRRMTVDGMHRCYGASVADRFGDSGTIGLAIVRIDGSGWRIDTFLLSCRVLGRGVERALLARVLADAATAGASRLVASFIPTGKNAPAAGFLPESGFREEGDGYVIDPRTADVAAPDWMTVL